MRYMGKNIALLGTGYVAGWWLGGMGIVICLLAVIAVLIFKLVSKDPARA